MLKKFLPIGTIVNLKNSNLNIMIIGFLCSNSEDLNDLYDYSGCNFPLGVVDDNSNIFFNHEDISKVIYEGYSSIEFKELNENLLLLTGSEGFENE